MRFILHLGCLLVFATPALALISPQMISDPTGTTAITACNDVKLGFCPDRAPPSPDPVDQNVFAYVPNAPPPPPPPPPPAMKGYKHRVNSLHHHRQIH